MARVLILCEFSGIGREAFRRHGHDAWSCDIQAAEIPGQHFHQSAFAPDGSWALPRDWDLIIAHPECTFLTNAGVRWLYVGGRKENGLEESRWAELEKAKQFFAACLDAPADRVVVENPIPHGYADLPEPFQIIQPWMFGHPERKATALWVRQKPGLWPMPQLLPTNDVRHLMKDLPRSVTDRVHYASGADRKNERSRSFPGIMAAMAEQWGPMLPGHISNDAANLAGGLQMEFCHVS